MNRTTLIDLSAPGGVAALLKFHRATFGDAHMELDGGDPADGADGGSDGAGDDDVPDDAPEGSDALGDAGKKALDAMKDRVKAERERRRALEQELAALRNQKPDTDADKPDVERIREEARAEARREAAKERVLDKIEAKAAGRFANPEDAVAFLGRNIDDFLDGDKVDVERITEEIDSLLEQRPYLSAQGGKRFQGSGDGGNRGEARKAQLTEADLARMSPAEIETARKDGRLNDLLGIPQ